MGELPKTAGSVIESTAGVWFVLYPPGDDSPRWEWVSAGGDHFWTDFDTMRRVIAVGTGTTEFGEDPGEHDSKYWEGAF